MRTQNGTGKWTAAALALLVAMGMTSLTTSLVASEKKEPTLNERIVAIAEGYARIHEALAADTLEHTGRHATAIVKNAEEAMKLVAGDPVKNERVTEVLEKVRESARVLTEPGEIQLKDARAGFHNLSGGVIKLVKDNLPAEIAEEYTVFYCPMAEGYWLQKDTQTRNPYYGSEMLECGRTVDYAKECGACKGNCTCEAEKGKCQCRTMDGKKAGCGSAGHKGHKIQKGNGAEHSH